MSDLLQLPPSERLALAIARWDSLDDEARVGALPLDSALCAELDRRWATHLNNPGGAVACDEVRSQLDARGPSPRFGPAAGAGGSTGNPALVRQALAGVGSWLR
ncbi:addiction module protein [Synechococcus sp. 1G10]|uniref:addiction module protein n=1 Tax=Synechococcus sp. 1G10 TaxID=2025605 RepID=UPI00117C577D|nr:addiction module protein [Synechococcus sp. 1G10]